MKMHDIDGQNGNPATSQRHETLETGHISPGYEAISPNGTLMKKIPLWLGVEQRQGFRANERPVVLPCETPRAPCRVVPRDFS